MKNIMFAGAALLATTGVVAAQDLQDLTFGAYGEYTLEAKTFEVGTDVAYSVGDLTVMATAVFVKPDAAEFDFDHVDLKAAYTLSPATDLYTKVEFSDELEYTDTTVGVSFLF